MSRISTSVDVRCDADTAWRVAGDLSRYDEFVVGTTHWQHVADDRYTIRMHVGAITAGGEVEVSTDPTRRQVQWHVVRGTAHTAWLQVQETEPGQCRVTFELAFGLAGLVAPITERLAAPLVRRNLVASLETLRHRLEYPEDAPGPAGDDGGHP